jgi:signal transduction histidine kinase
MNLARRNLLLYGLLAGVWLLVVVWQVEEHVRFEGYARTAFRNRSKAIANTLGASIRGLQFRGAVFGDRLQPVLNELVNSRTNEINANAEVVAIRLLNAAGETVASAGRPIDLEQKDIVQEGERWGRTTVTFVYPVEGASVSSEGATNLSAPVLLPPFTNAPRESRSLSRRENRSTNSLPTAVEGAPALPLNRGNTNSDRTVQNRPSPAERGRREGDTRPRRPFWARGMNDQEFQNTMESRELHGLVLAMSTDTLRAGAQHDLWLRSVIAFFATISVIGGLVAWRGLTQSSDLQIRLIRASELNSHLKEMNLAAAGLAHETRNPLNIIRGLAQMISRESNSSVEIKTRSADIINEADKVAAQLNEFINYSKPREVRRTALPLRSVIGEIIRALAYDLEEKKIQVDVRGQDLNIEADEQMLRQALFNLILNASQAVNGDGKIEVVAAKTGTAEASLEIRDNGPGVPTENRADIFKPYFTTQKTGTGLGLAVVQQIVLAHGWEIVCEANQPQGAIFKITHLKLAT